MNKSQLAKYPLNYLISALIILSVAFICDIFLPILNYHAVSLILLLTVSLLPLFFQAGPVLLSATLSALLWNFLFISPKFTFFIAKIEDVLIFIMYFIIAVITGVLTSRTREQKRIVVHREKRTMALYNLTRELSAALSLNQVNSIAIKNINSFFDAEVVLIPIDTAGKIAQEPYIESNFEVSEQELKIAIGALLNNPKPEKFTKLLSTSYAQYYLLSSLRQRFGIIGIKFRDTEHISSEQKELLNTFIQQITSAMEREYMNEKAKQALLLEESERLHTILLNSISHELKTPIATIMGAASGLMDEMTGGIPEIRYELSNEIYLATQRLNRLVVNLLDISRLESGMVKLNLDWHDINDLLNFIINNLKKELSDHTVKINSDENLPLIMMDFVLIEQAITNILINSTNYTPSGSIIQIDIKQENEYVNMIISDNGPGFPQEFIDKVFDKFYRVPGTRTGGTGLGLSIAKGFIEAHGGSVYAGNGDSGGAVFNITLPFKGSSIIG